MNLGVGGPEAAATHRLERELAGQAEAGDGLLDRPGIDAGIDQGAMVMSPAMPLKQSKYPTRTPYPFTGSHNGETQPF